MGRIHHLEQAVTALYESKNPNREEWNDWLFENHVIVVANYASELAARYNANGELARAAALLHDIADVEMPRSNPEHEQKSMQIAKQLLTESGFSAEEIQLIVEDAIRYHSCHGDERPTSLEGKILSTADSMAHLKTDFYIYATWALAKKRTLAEIKDWILQKIERDLYNKVFFEEIREELRNDYKLIKELFSR